MAPTKPAEPVESYNSAGAASSKPRAQRILSEEEIQRIITEVKQFPTLASTLGKVLSWDLKAHRLSLHCDTNYSLRKLRNEISTIKAAADKILETSLEIVLLVKDNEGRDEQKSSQNLRDAQADLVKKVFRGKIIDGAEYESNGSF